MKKKYAGEKDLDTFVFQISRQTQVQRILAMILGAIY